MFHSHSFFHGIQVKLGNRLPRSRGIAKVKGLIVFVGESKCNFQQCINVCGRDLMKKEMTTLVCQVGLVFSERRIWRGRKRDFVRDLRGRKIFSQTDNVNIGSKRSQRIRTQKESGVENKREAGC